MTEFRDGTTPGQEDAPRGADEFAMWAAAYVVGGLSDFDRHEFEEHLTGCVPCRDAVGDLCSVTAFLTLLDFNDVMVDGFHGPAVPRCVDPTAGVRAVSRTNPRQVEL